MILLDKLLKKLKQQGNGAQWRAVGACCSTQLSSFIPVFKRKPSADNIGRCMQMSFAVVRWRSNDGTDDSCLSWFRQNHVEITSSREACFLAVKPLAGDRWWCTILAGRRLVRLAAPGASQICESTRCLRCPQTRESSSSARWRGCWTSSRTTACGGTTSTVASTARRRTRTDRWDHRGPPGSGGDRWGPMVCWALLGTSVVQHGLLGTSVVQHGLLGTIVEQCSPLRTTTSVWFVWTTVVQNGPLGASASHWGPLGIVGPRLSPLVN